MQSGRDAARTIKAHIKPPSSCIRQNPNPARSSPFYTLCHINPQWSRVTDCIIMFPNCDSHLREKIADHFPCTFSRNNLLLHSWTFCMLLPFYLLKQLHLKGVACFKKWQQHLIAKCTLQRNSGEIHYRYCFLADWRLETQTVTLKWTCKEDLAAAVRIEWPMQK